MTRRRPRVARRRGAGARTAQAPSNDAAETRGGRLSARESEVLGLLADGMSTPGIGRRLFISPTTVRNHVQSILRKLGVHSRLEAVVLVYKHRVR